MNRIFASGLLAFFLLSAIASSPFLEDLAKVPFLLEHYRQHREADPGMSFLAFLHLHYSSSHAKHLAQQDHNKLPLKSHQGTHHLSLKLLGFPPGFNGSTRMPCIVNHSFRYLYSPALTSLADIWQPPRQV